MGAFDRFMMSGGAVLFLVIGFAFIIILSVITDKKAVQSIDDVKQHIVELERDLAECKAARALCDEMKAQVETANSERDIWRDLAVQCVGKKLKVKNR